MYQQPIPNYYQQQPYRNLLGLKGRPVSSLDEVRATTVDFDGSVSYFPNLANNTIYTKQINTDGTSMIRTYELVETPPMAAAGPAFDNLVTKDEFTKTINSLAEEISALKGQGNTNAEASPRPEIKF